MSEPCTCPLAGYCERHGIAKPKHWHHLCQTRDNYRAAWDDGRGPGQPTKPLTKKQLETKLRIEEARKRTERLISWITFFRLPGEHGAGDTAARLRRSATRSPDAVVLITQLMKRCACKAVDSVATLNKEHPYAT